VGVRRRERNHPATPGDDMKNITLHRSGKVTVWDVYTQGWYCDYPSDIPDEIMASLNQKERDAIARHGKRHGT
jgi:predicted naringenin-chalcone synthase